MCTILSIATDQVSKRSNHRHYTQCHQPTSSCLNPRKAPQIHGVQSERPLFSFKSSSNSTSTSSSSHSISHCLQWNPPDDNWIHGMGCPSVLRFSTKPMIWLKKQTDVVGGWELVLQTSAQTSNTSGYGIYVAWRSLKGSPLYRKLESFLNKTVPAQSRGHHMTLWSQWQSLWRNATIPRKHRIKAQISV